MLRSAAFMTAVLAFAAVSHGAEPLVWPQFRGPEGSGVAEGQKPPIEIGPEKNVKWKVGVPSGMSSPIVAGDLLVLTAFEDGKLYTIAYRRADGFEMWRADAKASKLEEYNQTEGSPAASTCATDGERIVSYFGSCGLRCYDLAGKELWKYELPPAEMFGGFGSGTSPVIADGLVVLLRDVQKDPKIMAIHAESGKLAWEKQRQSRTGYCTPAIWDTPAGKQIAAPGFGQMTGYDLKTGDEKWFVAGMPSASCSSPVTHDGELFFAAWAPGDPADPSEFKMPTFDELLKGKGGDTDGDGAISKEESKEGLFKDVFDSNDTNKDGKISRDEWDAILVMFSSSRNSAFALKPGGSGDVTETHVRWKQTKGLPYVSSAIVYGGQHVMVKDGGIVTAYDVKTGKEVFQKRALPTGSYYASPVAANGNIYFVSLADGAMTVLKAGAESPEVIARNPPLGERAATTPAIADNTIYLRTANSLYAFAEE